MDEDNRIIGTIVTNTDDITEIWNRDAWIAEQLAQMTAYNAMKLTVPEIVGKEVEITDDEKLSDLDDELDFEDQDNKQHYLNISEKIDLITKLSTKLVDDLIDLSYRDTNDYVSKLEYSRMREVYVKQFILNSLFAKAEKTNNQVRKELIKNSRYYFPEDINVRELDVFVGVGEYIDLAVKYHTIMEETFGEKTSISISDNVVIFYVDGCMYCATFDSKKVVEDHYAWNAPIFTNRATPTGTTVWNRLVVPDGLEELNANF